MNSVKVLAVSNIALLALIGYLMVQNHQFQKNQVKSSSHVDQLAKRHSSVVEVPLEIIESRPENIRAEQRLANPLTEGSSVAPDLIEPTSEEVIALSAYKC